MQILTALNKDNASLKDKTKLRIQCAIPYCDLGLLASCSKGATECLLGSKKLADFKTRKKENFHAFYFAVWPSNKEFRFEEQSNGEYLYEKIVHPRGPVLVQCPTVGMFETREYHRDNTLKWVDDPKLDKLDLIKVDTKRNGLTVLRIIPVNMDVETKTVYCGTLNVGMQLYYRTSLDWKVGIEYQLGHY
uniref:Ig-like domain-containing protein n=1 Tax=Rhabditophanes sp. KR3021 TaxID=114890 RepID=A0AC35TSN0_9BILA